MRLVTADEMQTIDRLTIDGGLVPALTLMENAGQAAATEALQLLAGREHPRVEIVCGKGNNGGDGLVVARALAAHGVRVRAHLTHPASEMSPDARTNHDRLRAMDIDIRVLPEALNDPGPLLDPRHRPRSGPHPGSTSSPDDLASCLEEADLTVDALLGTGVGGDLRGRLAALVNVVNRSSRRTLAIDVPSGVDGNTGLVRGTAVWADVTVTLGLPKLGLVLYPGRERAGRIVVADIGFPAEVVEQIASARFWTDAAAARVLVPRLEPTAHKYQRGCVLVLAGSRAYPGAAALCAEAALRAGAGIVHLVVPQNIRDLLEVKLTEVIIHGVPATPEGTIAEAAGPAVTRLLEKADALAIGPGLGGTEATWAWVRRLLVEVRQPAVVDADAIPALPLPPHPGPRLATPHPGELARWLGRPGRDVAERRLEVASQAAPQKGVVLVAKGAPTFVATPDSRLFVNGSGHAGLATAGSGDVLTGLLGGLLAQGMAPAEAAVLGVYVHGLAAEIASRKRAARSLLAGDVLNAIGAAFLELEA